MRFDLRPDLSNLGKGLDEVQRKQLPYALSLALTATAGHVGEGWQDEMRSGLDRPTPFTINSVGIVPARKTRLIATVYIKDIAANYLAPFVDGGPHFLGGKKGLLTPKNVALNAYGNLTKGKIAQLKAKSNVYVGALKLRSGQVVNGVWQRPKAKGRSKSAGPAHVKLLVRFSDPQDVTQRIPFQARAEAEFVNYFVAEFGDAFAHAMATSR